MPLKIEEKNNPKVIDYRDLELGDVFRIVEVGNPDNNHLKGVLFLATYEGAVSLQTFTEYEDEILNPIGYSNTKVQVVSAKLIVED